jgi:hypothetical protein
MGEQEGWLMVRLVSAVIIALAVAAPASAQDRPAAGTNREQNAPGAAGPKDSGVVQRGAQPNAAEVRPGNRDGDAPSASAGELVTRPAHRILGLPVDAALVIAGVVIVLALIAGLLIPGARRRDRARGGGTYGGDGRRD